MAHSHMVGGILDAYHPSIRRNCNGQTKTYSRKNWLVLLRVGTHIGHGSHQHANPPGFMHYDQEAMHQRWVYVMTCVYRVMGSRHTWHTAHTCTAPIGPSVKDILMKVILVKVMSEKGHIQRHNKIPVCYDSFRMKAFIGAKNNY